MHHTQAYVNQQVASGRWPQALTGQVVTAGDVPHLQNCLRQDAVNYLVSALVTFADAVQGVRTGFFTWATVKFYYTAFYALRAVLATDDYGVVYEGEKPRSLEAKAGTLIEKLKGTTHAVVVASFGRRFPKHFLLSQEIELVSPLMWLLNKREDANYRQGCFGEPESPPHFEKVVQLGIRKLIAAYLADANATYTFDADHAMFAFPLAAILDALGRVEAVTNNRPSQDSIDFLRDRLRDEAGALAVLNPLLARLEV